MNKTLVITYIEEYDKTYLFRTMQNIDEQTSRSWSHVISVDDKHHEEIKQLVNMRSTYYRDNVQIVEAVNLVDIDKFTYIAIHNIWDKWNPIFLETMMFRIAQDDSATAIVSQGNDVSERKKGNIIVTDNMFENPHLPVGILPLEIHILKSIKFIQILFKSENFASEITHPLYGLGDAIDRGSVLSIADYLTSHRVTSSAKEVDIEEQKAVNHTIKYFPYMR